MSTTVPAPVASRAPRAGTWWQRRRIRLAVRVTSMFAVALAAAWWFLLAPVAVRAHTVTTGAVAAEVMGTGTLEARVSAIVGAKIGGLIVSMAVDQGDRVEAGDLLFRLEDGDLAHLVAMAESEVAAAAATLAKLAAARRKADAVLAQATTEHERVGELVATQMMSRQDFDKAAEALSIAEAETATASAAILEGEQRLAAAKRFLDHQRVRLQETTIEAPFDGLVVRRDRAIGDVVTPGAGVFQLVSTEQMWVSAWVDETELARLAVGQPARVVFRSEPGVARTGVVARIGRETDRETRELVVDVRVDDLPANWAVGQRAEAYIEVARREGVTTLPADLVRVRDGRTGVVVADNGVARWREIVVGLRGPDRVEVLAGLSPGDVVVVPVDAGATTLRDGRSVRPE